IQPATFVLGTLSVSTTRIHCVGLREEKYSAATLTSSSVAPFATPTINATGKLAGSELFLAPLLKSASCCTIYAAGKPARLEFSGRPSPLGRWQKPHANTPCLGPCCTGPGIGGWLSGCQSGTLYKSRICVIEKAASLLGTCFSVPSSCGGCVPGGFTAKAHGGGEF